VGPDRAAAARRAAAVAVAVAVAAGTMVVSGCGASQHQRVSCGSTSHRAIFVLEAQAVPSATLMTCAEPLPRGWSVTGFEVRSGLAQFWLDFDQAGARAAEVTLTQSCDLAGTTRLLPATVDHTPVQRYAVRTDQGLTRCGAEAPPCPG